MNFQSISGDNRNVQISAGSGFAWSTSSLPRGAPSTVARLTGTIRAFSSATLTSMFLRKHSLTKVNMCQKGSMGIIKGTPECLI